jgi:hypothetical protein
MYIPDGKYQFEVSKSEIKRFRSTERYYIALTLIVLDDGPYKYAEYYHIISDMNPVHYKKSLELILGGMVDRFRLTELMDSAAILMFGQRFTAKIVTERLPAFDGSYRRRLKILKIGE